MVSKAVGLISSLALATLLSACASAPLQKPDQALAQARYAVEQARQNAPAGAQSLPLYRAQQKLSRAEELIETDDPEPEVYAEARRLAEEAAIDARLAEVQAEAAAAEAQTQKLAQSLAVLREELVREEGAE